MHYSRLTLLTPLRGTPANIQIHLIFLEITIIGLHFAADSIGLSSLEFFWWAHKFCLSLQEWRFSGSKFKVIQGHWRWYQSKARMRLPISPS